MRLVLIRHAQTSANIDKIWHGHTDTPLTDLGYEQIESLGSHFHEVMHPDVVYSSPLQRARLTAEGIADKFRLQVKLEDDLIEFGIGAFEDISYERLNGELNFIPKMLEDENHAAPGGESRFEVTQRVTKVIENIAAKHRGENVVIVSHGMAMSLAFGYWFGDESTKWTTFVTDNTAITEIKLNPHDLVSFNNSDHLQGELRNRSDLLSERIRRGQIR